MNFKEYLKLIVESEMFVDYQCNKCKHKALRAKGDSRTCPKCGASKSMEVVTIGMKNAARTKDYEDRYTSGKLTKSEISVA